MSAVAFPLPVLPAQTFRRSWLLDQCRNAAAGQRFLKLLWQLDPRTKTTARGWTWPQVYGAVAREVGELFPIYEPDEGEIEYGETTLEDVLNWGIPVAPLGNLAEMGGSARELTMLTLCPWQMDELDDCTTLRQNRLTDWVRSWWVGRAVDAQGAWLRKWRLPRGRQFTGVWLGLPDLMRWARGVTGNVWLDTHPDEFDGSNGPSWTMNEIRSLARLWAQAEPIANRANMLLAYVEAQPRDRLQLLYQVFMGEPEALAMVTVPKHPLTLAEVFLPKEKRR